MEEREQRKKIILDAVTGIKKADLQAGKANKDMPVSIISFNNLKPKLVENAISTYARGLNPEDVVVLCDMSLIGKGKKGLIFSTEGFYSWEMNTFRKKIPLSMPVRYEELTEVESKKSAEVIFKFKDGIRVETIYGGIYTEFITTAMNRILEGLREKVEPETVELKKAEPKVEAKTLSTPEQKENEPKAETKTPSATELDNDKLFSDALAAYHAKDYEKALCLFEKAAEQGFLRAQFNCAVMYDEGMGIPLKKDQALYWYEKAAEQGYAQAQFECGERYFRGKGTNQDLKKAFYWYEKAAEQDDVRAQFLCGSMLALDNGGNVPVDNAKALYWFEKAAEQGHIKAQYNCGLRYNSGIGTKKNAKKALYWYEKAANQGDAMAQYNLGVMYSNGEGTSVNKSKAFDLYKRAADQGFAMAQYNCGTMYYNGEGINTDKLKAKSYFQKAANQTKNRAIREKALEILREKY